MKRAPVAANEPSLQAVQRQLQNVLQQSEGPLCPVRRQVVESLLQRAQRQRPGVRRLLLARAERQLQALQHACAAALVPKPSSLANEPSLAALLAQLQPRADDLGGEDDVERCLRQQEVTLLGVAAPQRGEQGQPSLPALKSARQLRRLRLRRGSERQVDIAMREGPQSPGPLNPQMLAVKSLSTMQALSPRYLERFVGYLDTLLAVEQSDSAAQKPAVKTAKGGRKRGKR